MLCVCSREQKKCEERDERENERSEREKKQNEKQQRQREAVCPRKKEEQKTRKKFTLFHSLDQLEVFGVLQ
jgi:hypothetical protein